jgi:NADPH-dependent curcumin reductase CurA
MHPPSRQIILETLPDDRLSPANFRIEEVERPSPAEGEVLLRVLYITLDASNRAWMQGPTYRAALKAGEVMYGRALAEVVESCAEGLAPGDLVFAETGWREWAVMPGRMVQKRPRTEPLTTSSAFTASAASPPTTASPTSADRRRATQWWCRPRAARWARSPARSPN